MTDYLALAERLLDERIRGMLDSEEQEDIDAAATALREAHAESARLTARVEQRDRQIAVYNSGGFADADALAEKFIGLTAEVERLQRRIAELEAKQ